jgi:phosphosulfolactate synthase
MRQNVISRMSESFLVLSEVGKKTKGTCISFDQLYRTYEQDRLAGASYVIVEGRESGKDVGIYDKNGELDPKFVQEAQKRCGTDIIWEAPLKSQQATLIQLLGENVNLGNVASKDALAVEALRRGLRSDTFSVNLQPELSTQ